MKFIIKFTTTQPNVPELTLHMTRNVGGFAKRNKVTLIILFQEIGEFRKLLKYLNEDLSPIICILLIVNISFSASGIVWLLKFDAADTETEPVNGVSVLNTLLWVLIVVAPFIQVSHFATFISRQN
jgi:hypothetical protein